MASSCFRVFEIVNGDRLPVVVGMCRDDQRPEIRAGESLRWLFATIKMTKPEACRIKRERLRQLCRWATGTLMRSSFTSSAL